MANAVNAAGAIPELSIVTIRVSPLSAKYFAKFFANCFHERYVNLMIQERIDQQNILIQCFSPFEDCILEHLHTFFTLSYQSIMDSFILPQFSRADKYLGYFI